MNRYILGAVCLVVLIISNMATAQISYSKASTDNITRDKCFLEATEKSKQEDYADAVVDLKSCLQLCKNLNDSLLVHNEIARQSYYMNRPDSGLRYLEKVLVSADTLGHSKSDALYGLLKMDESRYALYRLKGDYDSSLDFLNVLIKKMNFFEGGGERTAFYLKEKSIAQWRLNRIDSSLVTINKSLDVLTGLPVNSEVSTLIAQNNLMLGLIYWRKNDLDRALSYYKLSHHYYLQRDELNLRDLFLSCNNIAVLYHDHAQYDSAIAYLQLGKSYLDQLTPQSPYWASKDYYEYQANSNLAHAFLELNQLPEAYRFSMSAIALCESQRGKNHPHLIDMLNVRSLIFLELQQMDEALRDAKRAFQIASATYDQNNSQISRQYNYLAEIYMGRSEEALAIAMIDSSLINNLTYSIGRETVHTGSDEFYKALYLKLQALNTLERLDREEVGDLYLKFKENYSNILFHLDSKYVRQRINDLINTFFRFYYSLYRSTEESEYIERMIELAEIKKSRSLLRMISLNDGVLNRLPAVIQRKEKILRDSISMYLYNKTWTAQNDSILSALKMRHAQVLDHIQEDDDRMTHLILDQIDLDLAEIMNNLGANSCDLHFFQDEKFLYAIPVYSNSVSVVRLPLPFDPDKTELKDIDPNFLRDVWPVLNISEKCTSIEIYPDGVAWHFDVEGLSEKIDGRETYLVVSKNLIYQYSYHYKLLNRAIRSNTSNSILGLTSMADKASPLYLPGAGLEIDMMRATWDEESSPLRDDGFKVGTYDVDEFKSEVGKFSLIHLALHSRVDQKTPEKSSLRFWNNEKSEVQELYAFDVANLDVRAQMVSLSSCKSAYGPSTTNEGILSLGRAFTMAGAKSVLASRRDVYDASTPLLMKLFYKNLLSGMTKSEALRAARQTYLDEYADNITSKPEFWSHFYIIGDDQPLVLESSGLPPSWNITIWVVLLLILLYLAFRSVKSLHAQ